MLAWTRLVVNGVSAPVYAALPRFQAEYAGLRTTRVERTPVRVKTMGGAADRALSSIGWRPTVADHRRHIGNIRVPVLANAGSAGSAAGCRALREARPPRRTADTGRC
jgi:hypothetical protein